MGKMTWNNTLDKSPPGSRESYSETVLIYVTGFGMHLAKFNYKEGVFECVNDSDELFDIHAKTYRVWWTVDYNLPDGG